MDSSFLKLSSSTAHTPPSVDFAFVNPNPTRAKGIPAQGPASSNGQARNGNTCGPQRKVFGSGNSGALTADRVPSLKTAKPGPISKSELSSGPNTFKLRASHATTTQKPLSNNLLRQEVFKLAHTLAPPTQQSVKMLPAPLSSVPPVPLSDNLYIKPSPNPFATSQRVYVESPMQGSMFKREFPVSGQISSRTKSMRVQDNVDGSHPERRTPSLPSTLDDRSSTPDLTGDSNDSNSYLTETRKPDPRFSPIPNEHLSSAVPKTPSRHSLDRNTPLATLGDTDDIERDYQMLQVAANIDVSSDSLASTTPQAHASC